ncbi:MAG: hypothetical protein ACJ75Z_07645 [Solirubrobacterales bacterium]
MAALLAASAAAIVVTQHLRDEGSVASSIRWKTRPGPRYRVCFRLTRDDDVSVAVVDPSEQVVRVLATDQILKGGDTPHCFDWDGRDSAGAAAAPAPYKLQLELRDADRVAVSGERLNISPIKAARTARNSP